MAVTPNLAAAAAKPRIPNIAPEYVSATPAKVITGKAPANPRMAVIISPEDI